MTATSPASSRRRPGSSAAVMSHARRVTPFATPSSDPPPSPLAAPRPPGTPLFSGFPGPLLFAWVEIWPFDGITYDRTASLRIRGYRTTNKGVAAKPSFDRKFTLQVYGLTPGAILDLVETALEDDILDFQCQRHWEDNTILLVQLPSFSIQIDGVVA